MDGQEYLNKISASNRPTKKSKLGGLLSSKVVMWGAVAVVALVIIIVIGALIGGSRKDIKTLGAALILHTSNTAEVISDYQDNVRSSDLRASAASLHQVLTVTNKDLSDYMSEKYNLKVKNISKDIAAQANTAKDGLSNELFEAKINGALDRIFAHKMAYEISLIGAEESSIIKATGDSNLKELLEKNYSSLENLYDKFNDFSEAK